MAGTTRDWLIGGASRALRKPVVPAAAQVKAAGHVTVTSRDLRRQRTPPATNYGGGGDDTDRPCRRHADEQQQQQQQQRRRELQPQQRGRGGQEELVRHHHRQSSSDDEDDSSVFADTLTSPQSVYSDARDELPTPSDSTHETTIAAVAMVVNGGDTLGSTATRAATQAFTIVKHRRVELNPTKISNSE